MSIAHYVCTNLLCFDIFSFNIVLMIQSFLQHFFIALQRSVKVTMYITSLVEFESKHLTLTAKLVT